VPVASIAVLPFADMSQAKDQEYFSDGLSEELLDLLAKVPQLHVAGRTSAFAFKGKADDLRVIGQKLNVATVLEGSVRRSGDKVRITTQLINVADGYHLWSETYDREMTDIFAVQDEIAGAVVAALRVKLLPQQQAPSAPRRSTSTDAYVQYLLGHQTALGSLEQARTAASAFDKAIALDPRFAAAYAGLAVAQASVAQYALDPAEIADARRKAPASADQALLLDPDLAEGYAARANVRAILTWDWSGAMADFQRALAMGPNDANTLRRYASVLAARGRLREAQVAVRKSLELDPLSPSSWNNLGFYQYATGQYAAARESLERALEINPKAPIPRANLGVARLLEGDAAAALTEFERVPEGEPTRLMGVAVAEHALGHEPQSQAALDALIALPVPRPFWIAAVYARRGDPDHAFEWLERAYLVREPQLSYIMVQPLFANIRSDPRYTAFLKKLGSPDDAP
jgi:TolB-like protein/Flp pilus assembly protein TadD